MDDPPGKKESQTPSEEIADSTDGSASPGPPQTDGPRDRIPSKRRHPKDPAGSRPAADARRHSGPTFWGWIRRTARLWGFLAFILLILIIFRSVILPFVLGLLVAYVLAPLVRRLGNLEIKGFRFPRFAWVLVVYVVLLGLVALFFTSFVPRLSTDIKRIVMEAPAFWKKAREAYVPALASWVEKNFVVEPKLIPKDQTAAQPPVPSKLRFKALKNGEYELDLQGLKLEVAKQSEGHWAVQLGPQQTMSAQQPDRLVDAMNQHFKEFLARSEDRVNQVVGFGQRFLVGLLNTITTFILVLMISAFLLVDSERILRWFRNLVPKIYYQDFDNVIVLMDRGLSGAIRGQFIICIINAVLTWAGLQLFDVKYPLLLGLLAGLMSLIPIFGSILSSIPIVLVALASGSSGVDFFKAVLILLWIIGIHLLEANLLNPKIMGTAAKIHPVIVIFAVVAGERTYGPVGALLGVPLVSAVQALFVYLRLKVRGEQEGDEQR